MAFGSNQELWENVPFSLSTTEVEDAISGPDFRDYLEIESVLRPRNICPHSESHQRAASWQ